jgi:uncharacterized protein
MTANDGDRVAEPEIAVRHDEAGKRFETTVGGCTGVARYELLGSVMRIYHTEVPPQLRSRGIAGRLVRAALGHAEARGLEVEPGCSYVRAYMRRHPETQRLLPAGFRL